MKNGTQKHQHVAFSWVVNGSWTHEGQLEIDSLSADRYHRLSVRGAQKSTARVAKRRQQPSRATTSKV